MRKKALVIGSGIGGLAVALRLKKMGFDVDVYEKNDTPGGKMGEIVKDDFRFDTGPSLFTLPEHVDDLFQLFDKNPRNYFSYQQLENTCKYHFSDGTIVNAWANPEDFYREVNEQLNEPKEHLERYLGRYKKLYEVASPVFLFNAFQRLRNFAKKEYRGTLFYIHKLDSTKTMHSRNQKSFSSEKLVQIFDRYATYNGSDPYRAPATLNMISHLEHNLGAWFPKKGMRSIIKALEKLALEEGVNLHFSQSVNKVITNKNCVVGAEVGENTVECDLMVSDADVRSFYINLMTGVKPPKSIINKELSSSAIIFYWGVNLSTKLDVHNILFAEDYRAEFEAIFKTKTLYHDPTVYIFISKKVVESDAPKNHENWFVMINVPPYNNENRKAVQGKARNYITEKINRMLNIDIEQHIVSESVADPVSIEKNTSSYRGALYGNSSNSMFAAFNRHANFSSRYKNLWFVGGSVHPGGGIPLCLASAKIVANEINERI